MRKWMRERLQRRKKKPAEPSDQPAPAPLQPAYFDAEPPENSADEADSNPLETASQPQKAALSSSRGDDHDADAGSPQEATQAVDAPPQSAPRPSARGSSASGSSAQANRGRRRRGGRGRGGPRGREQAVAQAFAPAAVKGSIPLTPESGVESRVESEDQPADLPESESQAASAAVAVPTSVQPSAPRPPKGIVVLAIGLPGSGKSSWFKRHNVVPLSSDMMRTILFDDVREQRYQDLVFSNLRSMLKARLIARRPMNYVDATNLTPQERQHWIKLARDYQYEVHAVFFDVPLEVCIERHQRRDRVVPDDIMRRMAAKLKPPAFEEGFAKITVVRVKKKPEEVQA
ncbi:MAG: AAA family ATPase [Candidatus Sulfotelmatobacter sp.]